MFCYFTVDDFSNITIKSHTSEMAELKEHYQAIGEPFNGDKQYWISVQPNMDINGFCVNLGGNSSPISSQRISS